jgi:hypothetical protein
MKIASGVLAYFVLLLVPVVAFAQESDWRSILEGQKSKIADRMNAIVEEGEPIAQADEQQFLKTWWLR